MIKSSVIFPGDVVKLKTGAPILRVAKEWLTRIRWVNWKSGGDLCLVVAVAGEWIFVMTQSDIVVGWTQRHHGDHVWRYMDDGSVKTIH